MLPFQEKILDDDYVEPIPEKPIAKQEFKEITIQ